MKTNIATTEVFYGELLRDTAIKYRTAVDKVN